MRKYKYIINSNNLILFNILNSTYYEFSTTEIDLCSQSGCDLYSDSGVCSIHIDLLMRKIYNRYRNFTNVRTSCNYTKIGKSLFINKLFLVNNNSPILSAS